MNNTLMGGAGREHAVSEGNERVERGLPAHAPAGLSDAFGPDGLTTRYKVFNATCSLGKSSLARATLRKLAFGDSIVFVEPGNAVSHRGQYQSAGSRIRPMDTSYFCPLQPFLRPLSW